MNKNDKEKSYSAYGEEAGGLNSDGLMGLPDPDTQQYGKYNINRDDSVDSEHVLPGVGPKYGINAWIRLWILQVILNPNPYNPFKG